MQHYDVVIIGGGVSGMSAALYLKKANISCCIFEHDVPGGTINYTSEIENYPGYNKILGSDLAYKIYTQLQENNVNFIFEDVKEIKIKNDKKEIITNKGTYEANNIIIATGRKHKNLDVPNEIKLQRRGISYCAICDAGLYKDKEVVVVGGGNSALTSALYLSGLCKKVTLIHRNNHFRGESSKLETINNKDNITIKTNAIVKEFIENKDDNTLSGIVLTDGEEILCQGCFICIGFSPATEIFNDLNITNTNGYIVVDNNMETNIRGVYAIGDVREHSPCQIVPAMSDGVVAALHIINNR